jgi:hypothetical protein
MLEIPVTFPPGRARLATNSKISRRGWGQKADAGKAGGRLCVGRQRHEQDGDHDNRNEGRP